MLPSDEIEFDIQLSFYLILLQLWIGIRLRIVFKEYFDVFFQLE